MISIEVAELNTCLSDICKTIFFIKLGSLLTNVCPFTLPDSGQQVGTTQAVGAASDLALPQSQSSIYLPHICINLHTGPGGHGQALRCSSE